MLGLASQHPHDMMGALYEDVERFFGDIFAWYGRIVARFPWLFVTIPMLVCGLLGLGLFCMTYETRVDVLYTPIDSLASKNQNLLKKFFDDKTGENFYPRQQISLATYGEVIVSRSKFTSDTKRVLDNDCPNDIWSAEVVNEIWQLNDVIWNISVLDNGRLYSYRDVCAIRNGQCVLDGDEILQFDVPHARTRRTYNDNDLDKHKYRTAQPANSTHSGLHIKPHILSGVDRKNKTCHEVTRIKYNLKHNSSDHRRLSLAWERQLLETLEQFHSSVIDIAYTVSESLDIELRKHVGTDTRFLGFSVLAMIVFATIVGSGVNCVTNHVTLAYAGVFASLMAILAAFGLLSVMGVKFVNLCGVMPFLVLGIGADDMFQLLTEWRQSNIRDSIEERMASTMRSTAVSITITSLTDLIAFCIGATSPYVSVRNFCACSGVAIFLCYVFQLTFYSGCIVLHARRVQASRHWITCCTTKSREELEEEGANTVKVLLCSGSPPRRVGEEGGLCRKLSRVLYTFYPRFLLHWVTKCSVFILFIGYISLSLWGATRIKKGLKLEQVVPEESYLSTYLQMEGKYFPDSGPIVTFMVHSPYRLTNRLVLYHHKGTMDDISTMIDGAEKVPEIVNGSKVSWLEQYTKYRHIQNMSVPHNEKEFIEGLLDGFFDKFPQYKEDVSFNDDMSIIQASRFYVQSRKLRNTEQEGEMMIKMRHIANSSPLSAIAYSPEFIYYEHYVSIMKNTFLPVGVTMIGLLFVALVFIPHPIAVTCVTIAMVSIVIGMVGFMHYWNLSLSAISVIQIIMSLGICVSFTVHMSHSFMTATGKNRNERVTVALEKVGIPILNGALSSLFCAVTLSFGSSFIFTSFFKTMVLVFFLGIIHSLIFLPVMLSFIGPRRTSKPRVFIPVSPSSRSLQDTYRANSLVHRSPSENKIDKIRESPRPSIAQELNLDCIPNNRELGTINESVQPDDIQINVDEVESPDSSKSRKVSFAMGSEASSRRESNSSIAELPNHNMDETDDNASKPEQGTGKNDVNRNEQIC